MRIALRGLEGSRVGAPRRIFDAGIRARAVVRAVVPLGRGGDAGGATPTGSSFLFIEAKHELFAVGISSRLLETKQRRQRADLVAQHRRGGFLFAQTALKLAFTKAK